MLFLVSQGVPYEVALSLPAARRILYVILLREMRGEKFDWKRRRFEEA